VPPGVQGGTSPPPAPKKSAAGGCGPGWRVIGTDAMMKRITCACSRCGAIRQFGAEALREGVAVCDCSRDKVSSPKRAVHARVWGFAQAAARLEGGEAIYRVKSRR